MRALSHTLPGLLEGSAPGPKSGGRRALPEREPDVVSGAVVTGAWAPPARAEIRVHLARGPGP